MRPVVCVPPFSHLLRRLLDGRRGGPDTNRQGGNSVSGLYSDAILDQHVPLWSGIRGVPVERCDRWMLRNTTSRKAIRVKGWRENKEEGWEAR